MAREFRLPDIGEGLAEAEIVTWLVSVGDEVSVDQNVVEVETDKAVVEIPIPYAGTVLHLGGSEGETIEVGEILIVVGERGEAYPPAGAGVAPPPIVGSLSEEAEELPSLEHDEAVSSTGVPLQALPVVRKLARELGVDLGSVIGTGPDGRITREDVELAAEKARPAPVVVAAERRTRERVETWPPAAAAASEPDSADSSPIVEGERTKMTRLRRTIAANMSRSWSEIPHVTTFDEVDVRRLLDARRALIARHDAPVSIDALVVKAVIPALRSFPEFNATLDEDDLIVHRDIHMGVAVDAPDGLMVVVVRDADRLSLIELSARIATLADGARDRALAPDELTGQTFTVSNIGAVGGGHGTPIVPYGTIGILSVGRAVEKPIVRDGAVVVAPVLPLSLSYDHRVIDGGMGRRFMAMVLENLAEPTLFLA